MSTNSEDLNRFHQDGYMLKRSLLSMREVEILKAELSPLFNQQSQGRILEKNGMVRSIYGAHMSNSVFSRLVRHPRILQLARRILQAEVYVYQFKINAKIAMTGDVWQWHQDFIFWKKEDGLPRPDVINIAVFLDDVNEFNGPMMIIPRSHIAGMAETASQPDESDNAGQPDWITDLTADLKYSLGLDAVRTLASKNGIVAPKGPPGSVLLFHCNVYHGSNANMSPFDRAMAIITYSSVTNIPGKIEKQRPDFLASRDHAALEPLQDDCLFASL
jgi:hypothetical protein